MVHLLLVAVGGAIGVSIRHLVNLGSLKLVGPGFPGGT
ncbi:fluoride efflux transporter CrcB, partial [Rhizobiaceae sp. 2RAB30]